MSSGRSLLAMTAILGCTGRAPAPDAGTVTPRSDGPAIASARTDSPPPIPRSPAPPRNGRSPARPAPIKPLPWPFQAWTRAEAFQYDYGWSEGRTVTRKPLTADQARRALALLVAGGERPETPACYDPRHAVVFFDGATEVGTVLLCFSRNQLWTRPAYWRPRARRVRLEARPDQRRSAVQARAHARAMRGWQRLFWDELRLRVGWL